MADPADDLLASYDYALDPARIAQAPMDVRSEARLLVVERGAGTLLHRQVIDLPGLLRTGDVVVVNDTKVLPARLLGKKATGARVEIVGLSPLPGGGWSCLVRPSARLRPGAAVILHRRSRGEAGPTVVIGESTAEGARAVRVQDGSPLADLFQAWGELPLPPYIRRPLGPDEVDAARYQTVFARHGGAVAAPTAGLHLDDVVLGALASAGVEVHPVTLHVGGGTFLPVRTERLSAHTMHEERFRVPEGTATAVSGALERGARVLCVGTTALRAVESWHRIGRPLDGSFRTTRLFLHPGDPGQLPLSLLTNFHLPETTLLVLVASLLGRQRTLDVYEEAIRAGYRFYSYGDATLLL